MLLRRDWAERFVAACTTVKSARRRSLTAGEFVYTAIPEKQCWVVRAGYIKLLDASDEGRNHVRLILGRGSLFGARPFGTNAFHGFAFSQSEQAIAHGSAVLIELSRSELEAASRLESELGNTLTESLASRAQFLERRLLWQFITPMRARLAAALRDMICFEGQRCKHGHTIDVRLTHQDLADLVGAARPVVSAELVRMRDEGLIEYTRCYICVEDLAGLHRIAGGK